MYKIREGRPWPYLPPRRFAEYHNEESTAGVRIERTFSLPITAICIAVAGIEPAVMPYSSMLSSLCAGSVL
ncbi:hypothetical protein LU632_14500 [Erwinia tracheiphila]|uniref:hypothetical protein n=1 Tax=Erwinia tracheiphila TaxID=65700 RepID=UPI001F29C7B4|nr:hypothetical protein [Erwinia tracheiphila]UIA90555.1 hypothetical protein LU632_14500 [Erwinia tracheiphila]